MMRTGGAAVLAALFLWAAPASAQGVDGVTFRLGDLSAIGEQPDDDTELVHFRRYGYYRGYYPRVSFSFGYYRPYYYGYRSYYSYYRPYYSYYSAPAYYYYSAPAYRYYYCPISLGTVVYGGTESYYPPQGQPDVPMRKADEPPVPQVPREEDNFRYDGGPTNPVPMPGADPAPQKAAPIDPAKGRVVSLPAKSSKYTYPAYGEKPVTSFAPTYPGVIAGAISPR